MSDDQNTSQNPISEENPLPTSPKESTEPASENTAHSEPSEAPPEALESSPNDFPVKSPYTSVSLTGIVKKYNKFMEDINMEKKKIQCEITEPSVELKESFLSALKEYTAEGKTLDEGIADPGSDFTGFVQHLKDESHGINMKPGYVPQTTYWIVDKDGYAGRVSIRHELNEKLLNLGGHIGYGVRPSKRGLGYGNKALELVLPKARAMGLKKVLLTCDSTNTASKKIIEANGGVLENEVSGEEGKPSKLRYWIEL